MEFDYFVVNLGLRLDYFDARTAVPSDFTLPTTGRARRDRRQGPSSHRAWASPTRSRRPASCTWRTGTFFRCRPSTFCSPTRTTSTVPKRGLGRAFGYADLEPQQTVAYELGLQQGITANTGLNVTVYYKDIRNLLGTRIERIAPGAGENFQLSYYGRYTNPRLRQRARGDGGVRAPRGPRAGGQRRAGCQRRLHVPDRRGQRLQPPRRLAARRRRRRPDPADPALAARLGPPPPAQRPAGARRGRPPLRAG